MSARVLVYTEEVAGGRRRTSAQPRSASAALLRRFSPPHEPHPQPPACVTRRTGAPHEGLLFAPRPARSHKHKALEDKPQPRRRED